MGALPMTDHIRQQPLADPRLEAARKIYIACYSSRIHPNDDLQVLSTAIRETKAAELAEALEELLKARWIWDIDKARAKCLTALASFKELANDR
jgi:hypothetical protein